MPHFARIFTGSVYLYMDIMKSTVNNKQNGKHIHFLLYSKINIGIFARSQPKVSSIPFKTHLRVIYT
jgi:hypothetical protein